MMQGSEDVTGKHTRNLQRRLQFIAARSFCVHRFAKGCRTGVTANLSMQRCTA
jgi:hypothetical protein